MAASLYVYIPFIIVCLGAFKKTILGTPTTTDDHVSKSVAYCNTRLTLIDLLRV